MPEESIKNVVLVHGGFVDGSGWQGVDDLLTADGYNVKVVQNPTVSLKGDVAATKMAIADCEGPVVLVGHSYGGVVVTEAGTAENVAALVYIAGFVPDTGESVNTLIADPPPDAPVPPILPPRGGFLFLDRDKSAGSFAADVPPGQAAFMADSQVPWGVDALQGAVTKPAWRNLPSWYLLTTEDRMIRPRLSGRCRHVPVPPSPRSPQATPCTSPSRKQWHQSSRKPQREGTASGDQQGATTERPSRHSRVANRHGRCGGDRRKHQENMRWKLPCNLGRALCRNGRLWKESDHDHE